MTIIRVPERRPALPAFDGGKHLVGARSSYPSALALLTGWMALIKARPVLRYEVTRQGDLYSSKPIGESGTIVTGTWLSSPFDGHYVVRVQYQACLDSKDSTEASALTSGVYIDAKLYDDDAAALLDHVRWSRTGGGGIGAGLLTTGVEWGGQITETSPIDHPNVKYPFFQVDTGDVIVAVPGGLPTAANRMMNVDAASRGANLRLEVDYENALPTLIQVFAYPAREHEQ